MDRSTVSATSPRTSDEWDWGSLRHKLASPTFLFGLAAFSILTFGMIIVFIGPATIMAPWDVFVFLTAGSRILSGQVPHVEFYTPVGPLVYWLTAAGMHVAGPSLKGYVFGNLIFLAVVAPWGMAVFFRKLTPAIALLLTLFIVVLITAPRPLGYDPWITSYAMIYNRYAWVLTSILFVQLFAHDRRSTGQSIIFDCLSSGTLIGLLFFCKISFFIFAVAGVAVALVVRPDLRLRFWVVPTAFLLVCSSVWIGTGISPVAYIQDILFAGKSQSLSLRLGWLKSSLIWNVIPFVILVGFWIIVVGLPALRGKIPPRPAIMASLVWTFVLASAFAITIGNSGERSDIPLFLIAVVLLSNEVARQRLNQNRLEKTFNFSLSGVVCFFAIIGFFGIIVGKDIIAMATYLLNRDYKYSGNAVSQKFDAPPLEDFMIPRESEWQTAYSRASDVPARINEGLSVLRAHVPRDARLMTLAFADPLSFALGREPPAWVPLFWDLGITFDRLNHPAPEELLAEVDFVIYPSPGIEKAGCCWGTVSALLDIYGRYLDANFGEVARSAHWILLKRSAESVSQRSQGVVTVPEGAMPFRGHERSATAFPLTVEVGGRYLIDSEGKPFLVKGDTAWSLIAELDREEVEFYLQDRRARGFNTLLINLIEHTFATDAPANAYGAPPFLEAGRFDMPNEDYFAYADWVLQRASEEGFLVLLAPAYAGYAGLDEGWYEKMEMNGAARLREYGRYVGNRYRKYPNIIWVQGGDLNPPNRELVRAVAEGIRDMNPAALHTAHNRPGTAGADYWPNEPWLEVNNVYSYGPIFPEAKSQYLRSPILPFILIESQYEIGLTSDTQRVRGQAYAALLTGAAGHVFGNSPIWYFDGTERYSDSVRPGWREALDSRGTQSMAYLHRLFESLPWTTLQPDLENRFLIDGFGSGHERSVAALTSDGSLGMVYIPDGKTVSVNMRLLRSQDVHATWYDPTSGKMIKARRYEHQSSGIDKFAPPGANHFGHSDWVLLLSAE